MSQARKAGGDQQGDTRKESKMTEAVSYEFTAEELEELVNLTREAGLDTDAIETAVAVLTGNRAASEAELKGARIKILIAALRYGGRILADIVGHLSAEAGAFLRSVATRLADAISTGYVLSVAALVNWLVRMGANQNVAQMIGTVLSWFF
ncbi:hypothetical protein AGRA3207_002692 [Actinomadura graeca]|uniref:Uncharacterized protein n=1 Tax=Actinomadura graeca TaxID=2750812 RepID=A0ABX8QSS7_9ACTN|nr:hypothetical protein [Actinomadura graeca]QXJ21797.1 hypothetical protein AGRA3207_002692 [Actinomadura graeca]